MPDNVTVNLDIDPNDPRNAVPCEPSISVDEAGAAHKLNQKVARSAKSGKFVSKEEADANPDTTVVETV